MEDNRDGADLVARWEEQNKVHRYEGESGVRDLGRLVQALNEDYRDIDYFLADNPGCQQVMVEWITEYVDKVPDWKERLISLVGPEATDKMRDVIRQNARAVINFPNRLGRPPFAEDIANALADEDDTLMNSEGEILQWVLDECQRALDEVKQANEEPQGLTLKDLAQASRAQAKPTDRD